MSWFTRFASRTVQKAHARVTAENARYVAEAIERDAAIERLTQERDRARSHVAELRRDLQRATEITVQRIAELDDLSEQVEALREQLTAYQREAGE